MKKLVFGGLFLALIGTGVVGCKKENNQINSDLTNNDFSANGKMLVFESVESYENSIEIQSTEKQEKLLYEISKLKFNNYFSLEHIYSKSGNDSVQEMDEFLGQLLNEDGIIQIGDYIYKVNLQSAKVFVLPAANLAEYQDLVNENKLNKNIRQFSTGDDVIYLAESGDYGEKCGGIDGGIYPCYPNTYNGQIIKTNSDGTVWRLNPFVRFFRAGIYFRLSSQFEIWKYPSASSQNESNAQSGLFNISQSGLSIEMFIKGPTGWWEQRPCNSNSVGSISSGYHYTESIDSKGNVSIYTGTRNLNGYYFFVQGRAKYTNGSATIASPYGGRNINSPY